MKENGKKLSKEAVNYKMKADPKKPEKKCSNCRHYSGKFECDIVNGLVSPAGICSYFQQR